MQRNPSDFMDNYTVKVNLSKLELNFQNLVEEMLIQHYIIKLKCCSRYKAILIQGYDSVKLFLLEL